MRGDYTCQTVTNVLSGVAYRLNLLIFAECVIDLRIPYEQLLVQLVCINHCFWRNCIHLAGQFFYGGRCYKVCASIQEVINRPWSARSKDSVFDHSGLISISQIWILLGSRQSKLFFQNSLVQDKP